jgi:ketosteroid isomerase-like protein
MTTQEIADRLVELSSKGEFETAQRELLAEDAVNIEPYATPDFSKETHGLQNIIDKGRKFGSMIETVHGISMSQPLCAGNSFAVVLNMDVTMKERGRTNMSELCVYTIKDGKIVSEQFYM